MNSSFCYNKYCPFRVNDTSAVEYCACAVTCGNRQYTSDYYISSSADTVSDNNLVLVNDIKTLIIKFNGYCNFESGDFNIKIPGCCKDSFGKELSELLLRYAVG